MILPRAETVNGISGARLGILGILITWPTLWATAATPTAPFVAGFERFARHGELAPAEAGRLLLGELGCTSCHAPGTTGPPPKPGPRLDGAGRRLQPKWLSRFLADPTGTQPGTTMPDVLHGIPVEKKTRTVLALTAFLATLREPFPNLASTATRPVAPRFYEKGNRDRGRTLFHQVGCVACHQPDATYKARPQPTSELEKLLAQLDPDEIRELGLGAAARPFPSVPHGDLSGKYTSQALAHFLINPETVRPGGRMPSLKLVPDEAADLVAFLHKNNSARSLSAPGNNPELVARGRQLFVQFRCHSCHSAGTGLDRKGTQKAPPVLARLAPTSAESCLLNTNTRQPRYRLDKQQLQSITAALAVKPDKALPALSLKRTTLRLNCLACHSRNKSGGLGPKRRGYFETAGHVDLGDEGRLPPSLDGVGAKLRTAWLGKVLEGTGDVRAHLQIRMPVFPVREVLGLPGQLAVVDDGSDTPAGTVFAAPGVTTKTLASAGRTLIDRGCVQCHPVRGERLPGVVGIDLEGTTSRIRPEWLKRFLLDPASRKARTRMPTFFPKGKTNSPDVLGGHVDNQLAALQTYLADLGRQPLPEKITRNKVDNYELVPRKRPLILRTFMQRVGRHAIAVGFPDSPHFAFDARRGRVVEAWRGRFLDAHATWFNRFIPPAAPLGQDLVTLSAGLTVSRLANADAAWPDALAPTTGYRFRGYRLDKSRVPTLLYTVGKLQVEDRLEPSARRGFKRTLRISATLPPGSKQSNVWIRAHTGKSLKTRDANTHTDENGLTVSVPTGRKHPGKLVTTDGQTEWRIPFTISDRITVEMDYRW